MPVENIHAEYGGLLHRFPRVGLQHSLHFAYYRLNKLAYRYLDWSAGHNIFFSIISQPKESDLLVEIAISACYSRFNLRLVKPLKKSEFFVLGKLGNKEQRCQISDIPDFFSNFRKFLTFAELLIVWKNTIIL